MAEPFEHVVFLSRSRIRVRLLSHLSDEGPTNRRELRDELGTSQSTVVRTIQGLEERGWVETDDGVVHVTGTGKLVVDGFRRLLETVDATTDLAPFLRWFPHDEFDFDLAQLHGANLTTSTPGDPYAPAREQTQLVETAEELRVCLPSIDLEGTRVVHERVTAGELDGEVIVDPEVGETIRTGEHAQFFREDLQTGHLSVYRLDEELPFYLGFDGEDLVHIGVEDDDGMPRALLETESDPVRTWAEDVYRTYRDRATELTIDDFS